MGSRIEMGEQYGNDRLQDKKKLWSHNVPSEATGETVYKALEAKLTFYIPYCNLTVVCHNP